MSGDGRPRAVIRAPNHLGEAVLALPALRAASRRWPSRLLVQVVERLVPVVRMSGVEADLLPLENRRRVVRSALALRRHGPEVGVLLTPSFSAALIFALAGVGVRRGTDTDARGWLLSDRVDRAPLLRGHRVREYLRLVDPAAEPAGSRRPAGEATDGGPGADAPPPPRLARMDRAREAWRGLAGRTGIEAVADGPVVGLVPGGTAPARRWPAERFGVLAARLAARGCRVRVFGSSGDRAVVRRVSAAAAGAVDLGGRTDLWELAGGLRACDAVVGNDTGAVHLAAAADRPIVVVWGSGDPRQTRPLASSVRRVGRLDLPCHPCLETECPRRGDGYVADDARRECLRAVTVDEVEAAARAALRDAGLRAGGPARRGGRARAVAPDERSDGRERHA